MKRVVRRSDRRLQDRLKAAGATEQGLYVVLYAMRPVPLFKSLQLAWRRGEARRHAQTTGLILGQLALHPKWAVDLLPTMLTFAGRRGPEGIDGLLLSCLSAAQVLAPSTFDRGIALTEVLAVAAGGHGNPEMGLFFADLSGPAALLTGSAGGTSNLLRSDLGDGARGSLFDGGGLAAASGRPGTFGQNVRSQLRGSFDPGQRGSKGLLLSCEDGVNFAFTVGGAGIGAAAGGKAGAVAGAVAGASVGMATSGFLCGAAEVFVDWLAEEIYDDPASDSASTDTSEDTTAEVEEVTIEVTENADGSITVEEVVESTTEEEPNASVPSDGDDSDEDTEDDGAAGTCEAGTETQGCADPDPMGTGRGDTDIWDGPSGLGMTDVPWFQMTSNPEFANVANNTRLIAAPTMRRTGHGAVTNPGPDGNLSGGPAAGSGALPAAVPGGWVDPPDF